MKDMKEDGRFQSWLKDIVYINDQIDTDEAARDMMETLTRQMAQAEGVTEELKRRDQMAWVQRMNSIRNRAEEIVRHELIEV